MRVPEHCTADAGMFFDGHPAELALYEALFRRMDGAFPEGTVKVQKSQISFYGRHLFAAASLPVRRRKDWPKMCLMVTVGLPYRLDSPRVVAASEPYPGRWTHHLLLTAPEDVDGLLAAWLAAGALSTRHFAGRLRRDAALLTAATGAIAARRLDVPLIMALGTGNKLDPSLLRLADISETYGCPLARVMRKELRNRGILHQTVVFSPEQPAPTQQLEAPPPGRRSVPASNPWVPATAGLLMGSKVVRDLIAQKEA